MTSDQREERAELSANAGRGLLLSLAVVAGVAAAIGSGWAGELWYDAYQATAVSSAGLDKLGGHERLNAQLDIERQARAVRETWRTETEFALLGGVLGFFLAVAGGIAGGTWLSRVVGLVVGMGGGAAAGAGLSAVIAPMFFQYQSPESAFHVLVFSHAALAAGVGAVVGCGFGLAVHRRGAWARGLVGGMVGGLVGVLVLETVNSVAFPLMRTYEPIPTEAGARYVLHASLAICTAVVAALFVAGRGRRSGQEGTV